MSRIVESLYDRYIINESLNDVITIDVDWAVSTDEIDQAIKETEAFGIKVKDVHDSPYNVNYEAVIQGTKPKLYKYLTSDLYGMDEDNVKRIYPELVE